jgi:cupin superfamily acireductone dioxygenase involved in methionine salvage
LIIEGGGYIKKAQDTGSSYFDIGNKWDKLSPKQRWNANKHFLDKISAKGDEINLSTPKGKIIKGKYLDKEINYLINQKGYRWVDELTLKKL